MSNELIIQNGLIVGRAAGAAIAVVPDVDGISTVSFDDRSGGQITSISFNHSTNTHTLTIGPTTQFQVTSAGATIAGDLIINGSTFLISAADLVIVDNILLLNKDETLAGVGNGLGFSGIEVERGSLNNAGWFFDDQDSYWGPTGPFGGYALSFGGGSDEVNMGDVHGFEGTVPFSIEAWMELDQVDVFQVGVSKIVTTPAIDGYEALRVNSNNTIQFGRWSAGPSILATATTLAQVGVLMHVAGTYDGTNSRIYINGVLEGTSVTDTNSLANNIAIFGMAAFGSFNGKIDDLRVWSTVRIQGEIQANMNKRLVGNEAGLVGYWPLDEGSGTTAFDATSSANNGTITGAVYVPMIGATQTIGNIAVIDSTLATEQVLTIASTGAIQLPVGTTAQQPTPTQGLIRYNTTQTRLETYIGSEWGDITGSPITTIQQGYIDGLILSNNATDSLKDIDISRGLAVDDTNAFNIILPENLLTYTEEFDHNPDWTKARVTISIDAIVAPDGTTTADKIAENGTAASTHVAYRNGTVAVIANTQYTASIYVKAGERTKFRYQFSSGEFTGAPGISVDLTTGTITTEHATLDSSSIEDVGSSWYRIAFTATTKSILDDGFANLNCWLLDDTGSNSYDGDGTSGLYLWGAQVERKGSASDYTKRVTTSNFTKQLDAVWAVGTEAGGLDTGTVAANTWYHVWAIRRSDTGIVDIMFSIKGKTPTMPTSYDQQRRIGAILTDATPNIIAFHQYGDYFYWDTLTNDFSQTSTLTTAVLKTMSVPTGIQVTGLLHFALNNAGSGNNEYILITSPDQADLAATTAFYTIVNSGNDTSDAVFLQLQTGASGQIRVRAQSGAGSRTFIGKTYGWIDPRVTATHDYFDTGWVFVGTGANDASIGAVAWTNTGNVTADDNAYAHNTASNAITNYLKGTNLGLSVPGGAEILGIEIRFGAFRTTNTVTVTNVRIVKSDGTIGTTNLADSVALGTTETVYTYGSNSELWGESWTPADVNDIDFGFVVSFTHAIIAQSDVDYMQVKVHYRE